MTRFVMALSALAMLDERFTHATSWGGSVDSEQTAVAVMPNRSPDGLAAATTQTVAASELMAVTKCCDTSCS